jgi:hypothetical protein
LLLGDDDGDDERDLPPIELSEANAFEARRLGVTGSAPPGWRASKTPTHVVVRSQSGYGRLIVSAPGRADAAGRVFRDAIKTLELSFPRVRRGPTMRETTIDDRPTRSAFIALRRGDGREVQAAIAVTVGQRRAYLVELFIDEGAAARRFGEAEAIIESLELSR